MDRRGGRVDPGGGQCRRGLSTKQPPPLSAPLTRLHKRHLPLSACILTYARTPGSALRVLCACSVQLPLRCPVQPVLDSCPRYRLCHNHCGQVSAAFLVFPAASVSDAARIR